MLKTENGKEGNKALRTAASVLLWIGIWWAAADAANGKLLLPVPDPPAVVRAMAKIVGDPSFWKALLLSALRVVAGFACAFVIGSAMAVLAARVPFVRRLFSPAVRVMRTLPVACFIFVIYLWMSTGMIPGFIAFIMALPAVYENIYEGIRAVDTGLLEMASVFGMDRHGRFANIVIPSIRPFIASCAVSGLGMSWKAGIASEIICRPAGSVGNVLWTMKTSIDYPGVFAVSVLILLAGIATEELMKKTIGEKK